MEAALKPQIDGMSYNMFCQEPIAYNYLFIYFARLTNTAAGRECRSLKEVTLIKMDVWQSVT